MNPEFSQNYEELYRTHWWFRARERILVEVIRNVGLPTRAKILDVGCGNGLFFGSLDMFGEVCGIETDRSLVPAQSPYRDRIFHWPLGAMEYATQRYDMITALDVIEHIENDQAAIDDMWGMLEPGGTLVITVPAFMMLWDRHDEINRHYRRYTRTSLRALLVNRGKLLKLCYMFHSLVVPKFAIAMLNSVRGAAVAQHTVPSVWINRTMQTAMWIEHLVLGPLRLPFGTSLLAVVQKPVCGVSQ